MRRQMIISGDWPPLMKVDARFTALRLGFAVTLRPSITIAMDFVFNSAGSKKAVAFIKFRLLIICLSCFCRRGKYFSFVRFCFTLNLISHYKYN